MPSPRLDVLAIGNAVVDVIAAADETFLADEGLAKGSMRLVDADGATRLYARMGHAREISGGSAANTAAGIAALGGRAAFVGQVANDQLGEIFAHDIRAMGVEFVTPPSAALGPTGRILILVTPDGQRTMNTFPGAAHQLAPEALDARQIRDAAILYLEGYLWDSPIARAAMERAIGIAHAAGRTVALTPSASPCILRHLDAFRALIAARKIDMLFVNEDEIAALTGETDFDANVAAIARQVPLLVATRGAEGAVAVETGRRVACAADPVDRIVDTTGAGDLFAAGFLAGRAQGQSVERCLRMGAIAAAEVISHWGARPEADLKQRIAEAFGETGDPE